MSLISALHQTTIKGVYPQNVRTFSQCARIPDVLSWSLAGPYDFYCGVYSSSGDLFFSGSHDGTIRIFDSYKQYFRLLHEIPCPHSYWSVVSLCLSPNERHLAYTTLSSQICLIYLDKLGTNCPPITSNNLADQEFVSRTFSVQFDGTGHRLISGNDLGYVRIHEIERGTCEAIQVSPTNRDVNAVATLDPAGNVILTGSDDTSIRLFDSRTLKKGPLAVFTGHLDGVTYIDSKGDGVSFLSNSKDQTVRLWDLRKHTQPGRSQSCRPRANWDYRVHSIPRTYIHSRHQQSGSCRGDQSVLTLRGHTVRYTLIRARYSPAHQTGQRYAYAGSASDGWCIWDLQNGELIRRNPHASFTVRDIHWHPWDPVVMASETHGSLSSWTSSQVHDEPENTGDARLKFEEHDPDGRRYRTRLEEAGLYYRFPDETESEHSAFSTQSLLQEHFEDEDMSSLTTEESSLDTEYENILHGQDCFSTGESDSDFALLDDIQDENPVSGGRPHVPFTRSQRRGRSRRPGASNIRNDL